MMCNLIFSNNILEAKNIEKKNRTWNRIKKKKNMMDEKGDVYGVQDYKQILIDNKDLESMPMAPEKKTITTTVKEYVCCPRLWKGMGLMLFYQFAGYNVVSFYATSIIQHPKQIEEQLIHPLLNDTDESLDVLMDQSWIERRG